MSILLITHNIYPNRMGGMSAYYTGYAQALAQLGKVIVLTTKAEDAIDYSHDYEVIRVDYTSSRAAKYPWKYFFQAEADRIVREYDIKVVLCGNFRPYADIGYRLKRMYGVPYVIFFHGNDLLRMLKRKAKNPIRSMTYTKLFRASQGIVANSLHTLNTIPEGLKSSSSLFVAYPGVDDSFLSLCPVTPFPSENQSVRLLTVCRLDHRKGVEKVLEALSLLRNKGIDVHYDVVGAGDISYYSSRAVELGISDSVTFHGRCSNDVVRSFFKTCDVFIMTSYASLKLSEVEGFGIVYLEANAYGKPVIGTMTGGIPEAVEDGKSGLLVTDPMDAQEIAQTIQSMIKDKRRSAEMGFYGFQRVNKNFSYAKLAGGLMRWLNHEVLSVE